LLLRTCTEGAVDFADVFKLLGDEEYQKKRAAAEKNCPKKLSISATHFVVGFNAVACKMSCVYVFCVYSKYKRCKKIRSMIYAQPNIGNKTKTKNNGYEIFTAKCFIKSREHNNKN